MFFSWTTEFENFFYFDSLNDRLTFLFVKFYQHKVKDIYGKGYDLMKLPAELVASSFGKACRASGDSSDKEETSSR